MSIPSIYTDVINGLLQKSLSKEVVWDVTSKSNIFVVYFKDSSLVINQHDNQNDLWISVDIINYNGEKIDGFWIADNEGDDWAIINELFSIARRSALAIDNTIHGMLSEINSTKTIGQKKKKEDDKGFTDDIPF